jgi:hypothetical protein
MGSILNFIFSCKDIDELESGKYNGNHHTSTKRYFQRSAILGYLLSNNYSFSFNNKIEKDKTNFYVLECQSSLLDLLGVGNQTEFDFSDSIIHSFDKSFIDDLRNKKFKIIVSSISEPTSHISILEKQLKLFFKEYNLSPDSFCFIDSNRDIVELNSKFGKTIFYYTPHFIYDGADSFVNIVHSVNYKNDLNYNSEILTKSEILKIEDRDYYFLSLNRSNWKIHRTILGCYFSKLNSDKIQWSYLNKPSQKYKDRFENLDYFSEWPESQQNLVKSEIDKLESIIPKQLDTTKANDLTGFKTTDTFSRQLTTNSYFQIVTESPFLNNEIFFSEKIIKPIIMMQPFILVSSYKMLENFKQLGFKTFDGLFDEGYDSIENNFDRLELILSEIDRVCKLPHDEVKNLYKMYFDICIYNREHLVSNFSNKDSYGEIFSLLNKNINTLLI